ncbi:hypothetical protein HRbin01_00321 [archaeon HR01]|nr:hypothetical protein HRbin01_00321 [archaeon HR01]
MSNTSRYLALAAASSPILIATALYLAVFDSSNPFTLLGALSLLMIVGADRVKWVGLVMVYVPAIYSVYLLIVEASPSPFVSLAAGYIIATPIVFTISMITAKSPSGLVISYCAAYISSLMLYGAVYGGYSTPERLFLFLVRGLLSYISSSESLNLLPPIYPETALLATPTALSTISLLLLTSSKNGGPLATGHTLKAAVTAIATVAPAAATSLVWPEIAGLAAMATASAVLGFLALSLRRWRRW